MTTASTGKIRQPTDGGPRPRAEPLLLPPTNPSLPPPGYARSLRSRGPRNAPSPRWTGVRAMAGTETFRVPIAVCPRRYWDAVHTETSDRGESTELKLPRLRDSTTGASDKLVATVEGCARRGGHSASLAPVAGVKYGVLLQTEAAPRRRCSVGTCTRRGLGLIGEGRGSLAVAGEGPMTPITRVLDACQA
jgi:hypothetical protein